MALRCSLNFFIAVFAQGNCRAQDLGLTFSARAEAGLDPATRELIETLPAVWRPQITGIVTDTLNEVDVHFEKYVDRIDKLITTQEKDLQCRIIATEADAIKEIVKHLPWADPSGDAENLRKHFEEASKRQNDQSVPDAIKAMYADDATGASILGCSPGATRCLRAFTHCKKRTKQTINSSFGTECRP